MSRYLFVYGTLLSGYHGAIGRSQRRHLRWHARVLARATVPGSLYDLGGYPGLLTAWPRATRVHGELWQVRDRHRLWPILDEYEGLLTEEPEYRRGRVSVRCGGRRFDADAYILRTVPKVARLLVRGRWDA